MQGDSVLTGPSWKNAFCVRIAGALGLIILTIGIPTPAHSDAVNPVLEVGDRWRYNIQSSFPSLGFTLQGTMILTVSSEENVTLQSGTYESFKMQVSQAGTVTGVVTGTWTSSGTAFVRKSDLAGLKASLSQVIVIGITISQTIDTISDSPERTYDFPLSVGKTWSETTTRTVNFTQSLSTGEFNNRVTTNTTTTSYLVVRTDTLTLAAGTFEAFQIHHVDSLGSSGDDYYSSQAGGSIRTITSDITSGSVTNTDLIEVGAWPYRALVSVSNGGTAYDFLIRTNVPAGNVRKNSTSVSFEVSGSSGLTGSAKIHVPKGLNTTHVRVYVDAIQATISTSADPSNFYVSFGFTLSSHAVTVVFAEAVIPSNPYLYLLLGIGAVVAALAIAAVFLLTKRRKPPPQAGPPPAPPAVEAPPTTAPPASPPSESGTG